MKEDVSEVRKNCYAFDIMHVYSIILQSSYVSHYSTASPKHNLGDDAIGT